MKVFYNKLVSSITVSLYLHPTSTCVLCRWSDIPHQTYKANLTLDYLFVYTFLDKIMFAVFFKFYFTVWRDKTNWNNQYLQSTQKAFPHTQTHYLTLILVTTTYSNSSVLLYQQATFKTVYLIISILQLVFT